VNCEIAALVFDLGGVIVDHDNSVMHRRIAGRCRAGWTPAQVADATRDVHWGTGRPVVELYRLLERDAGYEGGWDVFAQDFSCHLVLNASMLALVEDLAAQRRVVIFSNTNAVHWQSQIEASGGRLGAFECCLSYKMGCAKPSIEAFAMVAETVGLAPETLLFFDDVAVNVEGARRAGFQAELFIDQATLVASLAARDLI
jgi:FMN phosphatase YigB (HAD superfamily)